MVDWYEVLLPVMSLLFSVAGVCYITLVTMQRVRLYRLETRFRRQLQAGEYRVALSTISQALNLDPAAASLYQSRARVYYELGDYFSAEADYTQSMRYSQGATSYAWRAAARLALGETRNALIDANHAIACSRLWWRGYYERGRVYTALGHLTIALDDFDQAFELTRQPTAELFLARAEARRQIGRREEARKDYEQALKLNPNLSEKGTVGSPSFTTD